MMSFLAALLLVFVINILVVNGSISLPENKVASISKAKINHSVKKIGQFKKNSLDPIETNPSAVLLQANNAKASTSTTTVTLSKGSTTTLDFIIKNFLPLGFFVSLVISLLFPGPGNFMGKTRYGDWRVVATLNACLVFLISGLTLQNDDFAAILKKPFGVIFGLISILFVTPLLALVVKQLPLSPPEFTTGLSIFCLVPTTLSVGVALTLAAKGNQALALLLTVAANIIGVVTVPLMMKFLLQGSAALDAVDLISKLSLTVLVPILVGYSLKSYSRHVRDFVKRNKVVLSLFSNLNLHCMMWMNLSSAQKSLIKQNPWNILAVVLSGIAVHVFYLLANFGIVRLLNLPTKEAIAVLIMSSQKSAPVAVTIISYITRDTAKQGLMAIPCIVGQLSQIFIGSYLATFLERVL